LIRHHAERAAELDSSLAWFAATVTNVLTWRWSAALAASADATDVPSQGTIWMHSYVGEHEKALAWARRWVDLDPKSVNARFTLCVSLAYADEIDEAAHQIREAIAVAPTVPVLRLWLAAVEIARGNPEAAAAELARAEQLLAQNRQIVFLPELAHSYSRIGRMADVERIVTELEQAEGVELGAGGRTVIALALGDRARAIEQLEAAIAKIENHEIDEGYFNLMNVRMNVTADPVLEEPPFVELRKKLRGN
jgi:tetratricopeptide (TPR) repeat protein